MTALLFFVLGALVVIALGVSRSRRRRRVQEALDKARTDCLDSWWLMYEPLDNYKRKGQILQLGHCENATEDEAMELCQEAVCQLVYRTGRVHRGRCFVVPEADARKIFHDDQEVAN